MKKLVTIFFAGAVMLGMVFLGDLISSNKPFSVEAQDVHKTRRHRQHHRHRGVVRTTGHGTKKVLRKTGHGTKKVLHKTKQIVY